MHRMFAQRPMSHPAIHQHESDRRHFLVKSCAPRGAVAVTAPDRDASSAHPTSPWSPFRHPAFVVIWTATVVANLGTWMYTAASGWLMTGLDPDPLIVSLVQVAASLPIFLIAIPAGALADIVDRRLFLIAGEAANTVIAAVFAVLVTYDLVTPGVLLVFTFLVGAFGALTAPAWQAVTPSLVPKARPADRNRRQQRRLQHQPRDRTCARRRAHGRVRHRGAVLDQCGEQPRHQRRPRVVAPAQAPREPPAGGKIRPRDPHRPALRAAQSVSARDAAARGRLLRVRQRLLGAAAAGGAQPARGRTGDLRHPARRDRRRRDRRRLRAALREAAARRRPAGRGRHARHRARAGAVRPRPRQRDRAVGEPARRRGVDRGALEPQRVGAGGAARMGAGARARAVHDGVFRRPHGRQRAVGAGRGAGRPAARAFHRGGGRARRHPAHLALAPADRRRRRSHAVDALAGADREPRASSRIAGRCW